MRVLLNLPTALAEKVKKESQQKEIRKAIIFALEEYLRKKKIEKLLNFSGKIKMKTNLEKIRKSRYI